MAPYGRSDWGWRFRCRPEVEHTSKWLLTGSVPWGSTFLRSRSCTSVGWNTSLKGISESESTCTRTRGSRTSSFPCSDTPADWRTRTCKFFCCRKLLLRSSKHRPRVLCWVGKGEQLEKGPRSWRRVLRFCCTRSWGESYWKCSCEFRGKAGPIFLRRDRWLLQNCGL